jgi:hypothetical protein
LDEKKHKYFQKKKKKPRRKQKRAPVLVGQKRNLTKKGPIYANKENMKWDLKYKQYKMKQDQLYIYT